MYPEEFANEEGPHQPVEMPSPLPPEPGSEPTWPTAGQWEILNNFLHSNYQQMGADRDRLQQELLRTQVEAAELRTRLNGFGDRAEMINTVFDRFMDIVRVVTATHNITVENRGVLRRLMTENYERISGLKEYLYLELRGLREGSLENREEIKKVLESLERVEATLDNIWGEEEIVVDDMEGEFPRGSGTMPVPDGWERNVDVEGTEEDRLEDQVSSSQVPDGGGEIPDNLAGETGAEQGPNTVEPDIPPVTEPPEVAPAQLQPPPAPIINRRPNVEVIDIADSSSDEDHDEDNDADQSDIESECELESCDCSLSSSDSEPESASASESASDCSCLYVTCPKCSPSAHQQGDEDQDWAPDSQFESSSDESEIEKSKKTKKRPTKKTPAKPSAPAPPVIPERFSERIADRLSRLSVHEIAAKRNAKRLSTSTRSLRLFKRSKKN